MAEEVWGGALEAFARDCRARGLADGSVALYLRDLQLFARWYRETTALAPEPAAVTQLDVAEYRRHLQGAGRKPATVNRCLKSLSAFFGWAVTRGLRDRNPVRDVRRVPEQRLAPRALSRRELGSLVREVQRGGSVRDLALVTLLVQTGLRISEALRLRVGDLRVGERVGWVTVRGKGGKEREVPLSLTARRALAAYLGEPWPEAERWLFPGRAAGRPLTPRAVQRAMGRYARRAGLAVTPHVLRHTFCKQLVDAGESLDRVAALAGHASLNTTARYTTPSRADLERAVEALEWT